MSLYIEAASILTETTGSLKARIYRPQKPLKSPPARLYALIIETLKHQPLLNEVIAASELLKYERKITHVLALLLLHDHLLTRNGIATSLGPLKSSVLAHKTQLSSALRRALLKRNHATVATYLAATAAANKPPLPRWARVNPLRSSLAAVLAAFADHTEVHTLADLNQGGKLYYRDPIIENLLAFPPGTELTSHALYLSGGLILQDRSSCLPAHLLAPAPGSRVIDATAAPGNKTTHLAGLGARVLAFERDVRRAGVLRRMVERAGADKVISVREGDFLACAPTEDAVKDISHLLLDPSCSGSGIVGREEYELLPLPEPAPSKTAKRKRPAKPTKPAKPAVLTTGDAEEEESAGDVAAARLKALSEFQKTMVQHAMRFPAARRISYSTCSIHREENEDVVVAVLASDVARRRGWTVEKRTEGWRGGCGDDVAQEVKDACVRCEPIVDGGIGFFVVVFVRDGSVDLPAGENEDQPAVVQGPEEEEGEAEEEEDEEWGGFSDDEKPVEKKKKSKLQPQPKSKPQPAEKKPNINTKKPKTVAPLKPKPAFGNSKPKKNKK